MNFVHCDDESDEFWKTDRAMPFKNLFSKSAISTKFNLGEVELGKITGSEKKCTI